MTEPRTTEAAQLGYLTGWKEATEKDMEELKEQLQEHRAETTNNAKVMDQRLGALEARIQKATYVVIGALAVVSWLGMAVGISLEFIVELLK